MEEKAMIITLVFIGAVALTMVFGWATTYRRQGCPFNWRVFLGPNVYYNWIKRQRRTT